MFGILFCSGLLAAATVGSGAAASAPTPASGCYTDRDVAFPSRAPGISIAGTLSVPKGGGPHPAALLITGNGPHTREQRISGSPMFSPVFTVLAGMDENIAWREHLVALAQAIGSGAERVEGGGPSGARGGPGEAELTAVVLPDQDHFFLECEGRRLEKHVPEKMEIATELYEVLDAELSRRGLVKDVCPAGR